MGGPGLLTRRPPRAPRNAKADRAVRFINALTHTTGEFAGQSFRLRPWQEQIIRRLFGTLRDDGTRQYRTCYVEIPRRNGKTQLAAAIALYMLLSDGEQEAQVYSAAVDREQASLVFRAAESMVRADPELATMIEIIPSQRRMLYHPTRSIYRAIPADAPGAHGYNASAVIYDELHAAPDRALWDVLTTSFGSRRQPLIFVITTAGWDRLSVCWEQHQYAEQVRDGVIDDPAFLPVLYGAPIDADWQDEAVWRACNPALDDFRSLEEMRDYARRAREIPAMQNAFRQLYLCQWVEQATRWIDMPRWQACATAVPDAELVGRPCYAGLDLGQSDDFSAFVRVWCLEDGRVAVRCRFWLPEAALVKYRLRPYDVWRRAGALEVTAGDVSDPDVIEAEVAVLCHQSGVRELAYDRRFAEQMRIHLEGQGITCVDTPQGFQLNEALVKASDLVVSGQLAHGGDPVLTWMASNAVVRRGATKGDLRLDKEKAGDKIDGIAALTMALSRAIHDPTAGASVYERRGLVTV